MKTTRATDIHVLQNRIGPGGALRTAIPPSFVIASPGTATVYLGADPSCKPHRFRAGSGFVDRGLDVHAVRNEGKVDLVTVVVSLVPKGAPRRIDERDPGTCPF